jgi:DNA-binding response OmpR family regulator
MGADIRRPHTPARALLVIDRPVLAELVRLALGHGAYLTQVAPTPAAALAALHAWRPQLAIVDMDIAGGEMLDRLGLAPDSVRIPVIALTRRGDLRTKLAAFERGADDILTVPFSPEELVARTLAVMRRSYRDAAVAFTPVLRLGELEIDILNRMVRVGGHALHLTSLEQSLLYLLAANAGRLLTREEILDHLWGTDYAAGSNVVDRQVRNLRAKLQDDWRRPRYIATVPGQGYRFLPVAADSAPPSRPPSRARRRRRDGTS